MEKISKVAVIPCPSYDQVQVEQAVCDGLRCLGGLNGIVGREEKILLKLNLLKKADPDQVITTHPSVFSAVGRCLKEYGCEEICYGDSPAMQPFQDAARASGAEQAAKELGILPGNFTEHTALKYPEGRTAKEFTVSKGVVEADAIINICKMKTHALERITGAVKNMYGCIYGTHKAAGHAVYPSATHFASMLCDLHGAVKPRLHIMDGIVAMEGNGPSSGTPVSMGVLLFSEDPVALDTVFCHLIHLEPSLVPTNFCGQQYGIGTMEEEKIRLLTVDRGGFHGESVSRLTFEEKRSEGASGGEQPAKEASEKEMPREEAPAEEPPIRVFTMEELVSRWGHPDFSVDRNPASEREDWKLLRRVMKPFQQRPQIHPKRCIRCGICVESCPVEGKAVSFKNGREKPPVYDYVKCIRCYCCQEMCPKKAIDVKNSWLSRLLR